MIRFYDPKKNLGCAGVRIGGIYADVYRTPHLGMFGSINYLGKFWLSRYALRWTGRTRIKIWFPRKYQKLKIILRRYND